jgi:hypothetical protein
MEALKNLLTDFDPTALVPELDSVVGWLVLVVRLCVMAGPVVLLCMGLWFLLLPPKEANHIAGYRFFWGMGSVESWRFMQFIAGIGWTALGGILSIIMLIIVAGYKDMAPMDMAFHAVSCIVWEICIAAVVTLIINILVMVFYDFKGNPRRKSKPSPAKKSAKKSPKTSEK